MHVFRAHQCSDCDSHKPLQSVLALYEINSAHVQCLRSMMSDAYLIDSVEKYYNNNIRKRKENKSPVTTPPLLYNVDIGREIADMRDISGLKFASWPWTQGADQNCSISLCNV